MTRWTDAVVAAALGVPARAEAELSHHGLDLASAFTGISTDSRTVGAGQLFVALRGEQHDGHEHLAQAAEAGAKGAVVDSVPAGSPSSLLYYVVQDTLVALGMLARLRRRHLGARVCAVAGSNGKTTTKDMLRAVLATRYRVHATPGNFNNLVGAPLTLFGAPDGSEVVIAEIGTNTPGEIPRLAAMIEPDAAVITAISAEHLEGLGDLAGVLREETAVLAWLPPGAPAIVAEEPATLPRRARAIASQVQVAGFGPAADADLRASDVVLDEEGRPRFRWAGRQVELQLRGRHNVRNALLALAIGRAWGVDDAEAVEALALLKPSGMRAEFHHFGGLTVIADCYNSNPASVEAALDLLTSIPRRGGRVVVLGSMLEMGAASDALHEDVAKSIASHELDLIVATGAFADPFRNLQSRLGDRLIVADDPIAAYARIESRIEGNEVVLLKASRGVALERLLARFEEHWGVLHPHGEASGPRASETLTGQRGDAPTAEHSQTQDTPAAGAGNGHGTGGERGA
jgi:UDP-N-acetylmuramoyl-tripeptide--D-alanyl-D-alanine ligase